MMAVGEGGTPLPPNAGATVLTQLKAHIWQKLTPETYSMQQKIPPRCFCSFLRTAWLNMLVEFFFALNFQAIAEKTAESLRGEGIFWPHPVHLC